MGKPTICIGENKGADQLRGNREADMRLCFRYTDSTIPPLLNYKISSFQPASVLVQAGLCRTCSETTLLVFPQGGSIFLQDFWQNFFLTTCQTSQADFQRIQLSYFIFSLSRQTKAQCSWMTTRQLVSPFVWLQYCTVSSIVWDVIIHTERQGFSCHCSHDQQKK